MAATLKLTDIAHSSGAGTITVDSLATLAVSTGKLTVGGSAIEAGSTNILRKTLDYTIVQADVSGKSELIVSCNAASSNRTITLPAVATTGLANCIVTILVDATATSTFKFLVQDSGSAEVWTGYAKSDFVRLIVVNSVWVVLDHYETLFSSRYMAANQTVAASALVLLNGGGSGWTNIADSGNMFDNTTNYEIVMPCAGFAEIGYFVKPTDPALTGAGTALKAGTAGSPTTVMDTQHAQGNGYHRSYDTYAITLKLAATEVIQFWSRNSQSNATDYAEGGSRDDTQFSCKVTRTY